MRWSLPIKPETSLSILTFIFLGGFVLFAIIGNIQRDLDNMLANMTTLATVAMAMYAGLNLFVTLKQSASMEAQIEEMQTERKLRDNSIPWIDEITIFAKSPSLSYNSENTYGCHSNYYVDITLHNLSQNPILALDATLYLIFPLSWFTETTSEYISVIPGLSKSYAISEFCCTETSDVYASLRGNDANYYPKLQTKFTYKTFSGGCFTLTNNYLICQPETEEEMEALISWNNFISKINFTCPDEMKTINELLQIEKNEEAVNIWKNVCDKNSFDTLRKESVRLWVREIPGSLDIQKISDDEYKQIVLGKRYEIPLQNIPNSRAVRSTRFKKEIRIE